MPIKKSGIACLKQRFFNTVICIVASGALLVHFPWHNFDRPWSMAIYSMTLKIFFVGSFI